MTLDLRRLIRIRAVVCLVLGLFGAVPLVWLTPPFQVPDEAQHFFKAYQVSELEFRGSVEHGKVGGLVPISLTNLAREFLGTLQIHVAGRPAVPLPLSATLRASNRPLAPSERTFVDFSGAAFYAPFAYLPQAIAIACGRMLGAGPLELLYAARLVNALAAIAILSWAVQLLPVAKEATLLGGLLPMALFVYASVSPDALLVSSAFLFTAVSLRVLVGQRVDRPAAIAAGLAGITFCSLKPVYFPLLFLMLPAIFRESSKSQAARLAPWFILAPLAVTAAWVYWTSASVVPVRVGTDISLQTKGIWAHPLDFARNLVWTAIDHRFYLQQIVGVLGWLTVFLPKLGYVLAPVAFAWLALVAPSSAPRLQLPQNAWAAVLLLACGVLVMTALYLYWTPVGAYRIEGVQGRYFLPVLCLLAVVATSFARLPVPSSVGRLALPLVVITVVVEIVLMQASLISAYGVFG